MGQATVDLPDPVNQPDGAAAATDAASADDLLSQLAGEEIDRLLAEADAKPAEETESNSPGALRSRIRRKSESAPASASPAASAATTVAPKPPVTASAVADSPETAAEIDDVFNQIESSDSKAAAEAVAAPVTANQSDDVEPATIAAERAALAASLDASRSNASTADLPALHNDAEDAAAASIDSAEQTLPIYLRPLEWLNAPLMLLPEPVRELLGKVAIVTLVNAIAVLIYVLVFRR